MYCKAPVRGTTLNALVDFVAACDLKKVDILSDNFGNMMDWVSALFDS